MIKDNIKFYKSRKAGRLIRDGLAQKVLLEPSHEGSREGKLAGLWGSQERELVGQRVVRGVITRGEWPCPSDTWIQILIIEPRSTSTT